MAYHPLVDVYRFKAFMIVTASTSGYFCPS
jgi:hypothetical protein